MSCKCFYCGAFVRWDGDYDDGDDIVSDFHCGKCGVEYITLTKNHENESN